MGEKLLSKFILNSEGIIIPPSVSGSDLSTSISIIKSKLKDVLLETQKFDPNTQVGWKKSDEWYPENFSSPEITKNKAETKPIQYLCE